MNKKILIDCNVLISAGLGSNSCKTVIKIAIENYDICITNKILEEYVNVCSRKKFAQYFNNLKELCKIVASVATILEDTQVNIKTPDIKDLPYIAAALNHSIDFIVTGNIKDFPNSPYNKANVITPAEFIEIITN